jgi:Tfp pilus assembly protein PilN
VTDRQTSWVLFGFAMVVSFIFLSVLIKVNYDLDQARRANDSLQNQIDQLKKVDDEQRQKIVELTKSTQSIARDVDVTQELQRKQAQIVVDLKKGRKK